MHSFSSFPGEPFFTFCFPPRGVATSMGTPSPPTPPPPLMAARMASRRCLARSSPLSAALTYQTFASRMSRRQPMPVSVK